DQEPAEQRDRPPRITFGYNKDHRPDLKQLLFSITISADGAVPVHCKTYDGNVTEDQVHIETWDFLHALVGHADFLYVADCKLCTGDTMGHIAGSQGKFLTVLRGRGQRTAGSGTICKTTRRRGVRSAASRTHAGRMGRTSSTMAWRAPNVRRRATGSCGIAA